MLTSKWRTMFEMAHSDNEITVRGECGQVTFTVEGEVRLENGYENSIFATSPEYVLLLRALFIMRYPMKTVIDLADQLLQNNPIAMRAVESFIELDDIRFILDTYVMNYMLQEPE